MRRFHYFILLSVLLAGSLHGQIKTEYEQRISMDSFPQQARIVLSTLPKGIKKQRFFKELSADKISYEAKFKYDKKYFSIEFSETGVLEDVEVNIKEQSIPTELRTTMNAHFKSNYKKYRWLKIQEQFIYTGQLPEGEFIRTVLQGNCTKAPFYEIITEVKKNRSYLLMEYNFNDEGQKITEKLIDPESYAHVLY